MKNIVLIGLMASGKTTIAKELSKNLKKDFLDIDFLIEAREGKPISEIFSENGESYFRNLEKTIVAEVSLLNDSILSTGGGVILNEDNMANLKKNGIIVFIHRGIEDTYDSLTKEEIETRPLLLKSKESKDNLRKLYAERIELYHKYADIVIENNQTIEEVTNELITRLFEYENSNGGNFNEC